MLAEDAIVLDAFHPCLPGAGDGVVVNHAVLQPEIRDAETDHVINDCGHVLGGAKHIDKVDAGLSRIELSVGFTGSTR